MATRLLWKYTLTDCTVHDSVCNSISYTFYFFATVVFFLYENSPCTLKVSVVVKKLAQHLWTQYGQCDFLLVFCFAA